MEIETIYGLCNRLQTIIGFYTYYEKLNVLWGENEECPGDFLDFFECIKDVKFIKQPTNKLFGRFYRFNTESYQLNEKFPISFIGNHKIIRPNKEIKNQIEKACTNSMIGLHIRRTDFLPHIKKFSPNLIPFIDDNYFLNIIRNILKKKPKQLFYLSTDNRETQKIFFNLFPKNIKFQKVISENNSTRKTSLKESIIDLFSLIECKEFYGTKESSFSIFVENYRKSKLKNIT